MWETLYIAEKDRWLNLLLREILNGVLANTRIVVNKNVGYLTIIYSEGNLIRAKTTCERESLKTRPEAGSFVWYNWQHCVDKYGEDDSTRNGTCVILFVKYNSDMHLQCEFKSIFSTRRTPGGLIHLVSITDVEIVCTLQEPLERSTMKSLAWLIRDVQITRSVCQHTVWKTLKIFPYQLRRLAQGVNDYRLDDRGSIPGRFSSTVDRKPLQL